MLSLNRPIDPNPFFGREEELKIMDERFEKTGQTLLVHAEGGMGKTTLASKYWYNSEYHYSYQCWLFCDLGVMDAIKSLAPMLGLVAKKFSKLDSQEQVSFLKTAILKLKGDFLVVLDNANDAAQIQDFLRYFRGFSWNVLITSRCTEVLESTRDEILLQHLKPEDAKKLFLKYYQEDNEDFERLLERFLEGLNYHTLLIEIFAKNLKESAELGMDLKGFLEELETKGLVLDADNNFEVKSAWAGNLDKKADTTNDILGVLYDFGQLIDEERLFLVKMSLLPSESYTLPFLLEIFEPDDKRAFRDVLKNLFRKGWIGGSADGNQTQYRLSPVIQNLVQIKNKETLWEDGKEWVKKFTSLIELEDEKENAHTKFKWIPFGRHLAKMYSETDSYEFIQLLNKFGSLLIHKNGRKNLEEAKFYLEKALVSDIETFGENTRIVVMKRSILARALLSIGGVENLLKAKTYFEDTYYFNLKILGENFPSMISACNNLGKALSALGGEENLKEAKTYIEKALLASIRDFGENSPQEAICRSNLAGVLLDLGGERHLLDAKINCEKALASDIFNFGEDSISTARSRSNLATVLQTLGGEVRILEAKEHLELAIASDIRNLGEESSTVALNQSKLATVLINLGGEVNLLNAQINLEKALSTTIREFGEEHPETFWIKYLLGYILVELGGIVNSAKALTLLDDAIRGYKQSFADDYFMVERILKTQERLMEKFVKNFGK